MNYKMDKKELAIKLSKLKQTENKNVDLEQYQTESELAATILWKAYANGDIEDKVVGDFGSGNGIFGVGALLLGAKKVYFIDVDKNAIEKSKENSKGFKNTKFINYNILEFKNKIDTVVMNPPFGVQKRKADKDFLISAFKNSKVIYSIHKIESGNFIDVISKEYGFKVEEIIKERMKLSRTYNFHTSDKYYVEVGIWIIRKNE